MNRCRRHRDEASLGADTGGVADGERLGARARPTAAPMLPRRPASPVSRAGGAGRTRCWRRMTLEEKLGQLQQLDGEANGRFRPEHLELARKGLLGSVLNVRGAAQVNELQKAAVEGSRLKIPHPLRLRHHPRLPHHLPHPAGRGRQLRSGAGRGDRARGRGRVGRGRPQVDVRADGGRRARPALGPRRGGRGRGSVPGQRAGARARARVPGRGLRAAGPRGRDAPSTGSRTARPRPGATTTRPTSRSARCARSTSRPSRPRSMRAWARS